MSSNRSLRKRGWKLVAITSAQHLGTTLAILGLRACLVKTIPGTDSRRSHWHVSDDGYMYRIYNRSGKQMKPVVRRGKAS